MVEYPTKGKTPHSSIPLTTHTDQMLILLLPSSGHKPGNASMPVHYELTASDMDTQSFTWTLAGVILHPNNSFTANWWEPVEELERLNTVTHFS